MKSRLTKPKLWYHISHVDLGDTVEFSPRQIHEEGEPRRARICVAPTVAHCLAAIKLFRGPYSIYRTRDPVVAYYPYRVCDVRITRERWLLHPTVFVKTGIVSPREWELNVWLPRGNPDLLFHQQQEYWKICRALVKHGEASKPGMVWPSHVHRYERMILQEEVD